MNASRAAFLRAFAASAFFIVPALLAPACNNNDVSIGQDKQPVACQSNADCPPNVPCQNGFCAIPCSNDSDCSNGEVCVNGLCKGQNQGCQPKPEACDGLDNNCNGMVDEGAMCPSGYSCMNGACCGGGICLTHCNVDADCPPNQQCVNGQCSPIGCQPQPEVCDGLDNDCNGMVDEGAPCPAGEVCQNGQCKPIGCQPQPEICDGIDNDCDGMVDDGATCPNGYSCMNGACCGGGACLKPCFSNADCAAGQTCMSGACVP